MKLGMIYPIKEESFIDAAEKGLDFVEFCINAGYDADGFFNQLPQIKEWMEKYHVGIGSIGRWKAFVQDENGMINQDELILAFKLIEAANYLDCPNYVCGCNYVDTLTYYDNCTNAIEFLSKLLKHGKNQKVAISTYNCRKVNFIHNPIAWKVIHGHLKDLGIKYDPSHPRYNDGDYLKEAMEWGDRFYHIHLKGSLIVDGQKVDDPPAGLDQTDWKSLISILYTKNYNGGLSIEPHSPTWKGDLGDKGVNYTINYMKSLLL